MLDCLDRVAATIDEPIVAQSATAEGNWPHLEIHATLSPPEFAANFEAARVVVAHAGIGTILSAKKHHKPLIIMPRRFDLGEHRNDHQSFTARQVENEPGIYLAWNEEDLAGLLMAPMLAPASDDIVTPGRQALVIQIKSLVDGRA